MSIRQIRRRLRRSSGEKRVECLSHGEGRFLFAPRLLSTIARHRRRVFVDRVFVSPHPPKNYAAVRSPTMAIASIGRWRPAICESATAKRIWDCNSNACRRTAQVFTIELDQIEGAQDGGMVVAPGSRQVKGGEAAFVDHDGPPSIKHDSTGRLSRAAAIRGKRVARL